MARISASIPEELKDQLYRYATDHDEAISHIVADALKDFLGGSTSGPNSGKKMAVGAELYHKLDELSDAVRGLREELASRTPPRNARYF